MIERDRSSVTAHHSFFAKFSVTVRNISKETPEKESPELSFDMLQRSCAVLWT
jgi:hypothetical protein